MFDSTGWLMGIDAYAFSAASAPAIAAWRGPHGERIQFIKGYLKNLTLATVDAFLDAGIHVGAIWEVGADDALQGAAAGTNAGTRALAMMRALQAPSTASVAFTVDNAADISVVPEIADYFAAADAQLWLDDKPLFQIEGYADGTALSGLRQQGLPLCWLAGAMGWPGSEDFLQNGNPDMVQGATIGRGGIWMARTWPDLGFSYDPNIARPDYPGFIPAIAPAS